MPTTQEQPALLRIDELTTVLQLSRSHIYRLISTGRLRTVKIGKAARVSRTEIERFLRQLEADQWEQRAETGER